MIKLISKEVFILSFIEHCIQLNINWNLDPELHVT